MTAKNDLKDKGGNSNGEDHTETQKTGENTTRRELFYIFQQILFPTH
jgi:hypothetical protein